MQNYRLHWANKNDQTSILKLVELLLIELGEEGKEFEALDSNRLLGNWQIAGEHAHVLLAQNHNGEAIGILTLSENFAIYAGGFYGIINEMYVLPKERCAGLGGQMLQVVARFGRTKLESYRCDRANFRTLGQKQKFLRKKWFCFYWTKTKTAALKSGQPNHTF